jgi:hypothetical protein
MSVMFIRESLGTAKPGLPHGKFSKEKSQFGLILRGLELEKVYTYIWPVGI